MKDALRQSTDDIDVIADMSTLMNPNSSKMMTAYFSITLINVKPAFGNLISEVVQSNCNEVGFFCELIEAWAMNEVVSQSALPTHIRSATP
jgi:hypothetical protein